jgi:hypothetical protein
MGAQHHQAIPISAWQKGIRPMDGERLWKAVRHDLTTPGLDHACGGYAGNRHLVPYLEYGYVPDEDGPASNTLEYAYDDWAASQLALALGKKEEGEIFRKRSESWRNLFDPATGFIRRRHRDGSFVEPFDPFRYGTQGGWNGDLYAYLEHNGVISVLLNRPGRTALNSAGAASSGMQLLLADTALTDIHTAISGTFGALATGTYQPDGRAEDPGVVRIRSNTLQSVKHNILKRLDIRINGLIRHVLLHFLTLLLQTVERLGRSKGGTFVSELRIASCSSYLLLQAFPELNRFADENSKPFRIWILLPIIS